MNIPKEVTEAAAQAWEEACEQGKAGPGYRDAWSAALEAALAVMHPRVSTFEELEALPDGTIIKPDRGRTQEADTWTDIRYWLEIGTEIPGRSGDIYLPATVIYRP